MWNLLGGLLLQLLPRFVKLRTVKAPVSLLWMRFQLVIRRSMIAMSAIRQLKLLPDNDKPQLRCAAFHQVFTNDLPAAVRLPAGGANRLLGRTFKLNRCQIFAADLPRRNPQRLQRYGCPA